MTMPAGMSTVSAICDFFSTGRRLAMICSVDSRRSNWRRSAWLRSTATCLNDCTSSPARCRLATSWLAASRPPSRNSSSRERRSGPELTSRGEIVATPREARGHGQADADRIVDLMRHAGDQAAERGELLGGDQVLLRLPQVLERDSRRAPSRPAARSRPCAWRCAFSRKTSTARAISPISSRALRAADRLVVFLRDDGLHRRHDLLERQADAARDQHADDDDQRSERSTATSATF